MKKLSFHPFKSVRIYFGISLIVLLLDQLAKRLIEGGVIRISFIYNEGAIMGLFRNLDPAIRIPFFFVFSLLAVLFILFYIFTLPLDEKWNLFGLSLIMGGALGNLLDRVLFGKVLDFIQTSFWPTFNIADSAISTGVAILIFKTVFPGKKTDKEAMKKEKPVEERK
jgi:signal peptidase II